MRPGDPSGYGRLIMQGDQLVAIREERDASEEERKIGFVNGGIMGLAGETALSILDAIEDRNDQKEFYLTDAVEIAHKRGLKVAAVEIAAEDVFGINDRAQLAEAERLFQEKRRAEAMAAGATLDRTGHGVLRARHEARAAMSPSSRTSCSGRASRVADNVTIRAFSHIEGASIASGAIVGPFARLRPGAKIGENAHIGNFVEIKAADVEEGAKINHLAYIGDARVGAKTNIGAGTITCNYDGVNKHQTDIGKNAFIGSNSVAGRAGHDRRRRLCRLRERHHRGRCRRRDLPSAAPGRSTSRAGRRQKLARRNSVPSDR